MSALLLPELAREMEGSNRRVAEALEAESRQLEKLREQLEEADSLRKRALRSVRGATRATLSRKPEAVGIWNDTLELFKDGLSGEQAREMLASVEAIFASWLRLAQNNREIWRVAVKLGGSPEGLAELDAAEQEVQQIQATVAKMNAFLTGSRSPPDGARLQKGCEESSQGKVKSAEEMRSRLGGGKA